jgi:hypothetical protein
MIFWPYFSGFWLWGHLKSLVHSALINELEILQQQAENAYQEVRVKQGNFQYSAYLCATKS